MQRDRAVGADGGEFGIEPDVAASAAIEEFAVDDQAGLRKQGADRHCFAPSGMGDHHVGCEAGRGERRQRVRHLFGAVALQLEATGERMRR